MILNVNGPKGPLWYRLVGVFYVEVDDNNQQVNPSVLLATKSSTISEGSYFKAYIPNANRVYSFVPTSIADRVEERKKIPFNLYIYKLCSWLSLFVIYFMTNQ